MDNPTTQPAKPGILKSMLICLPMVLLILMMMSGGRSLPSEPRGLIAWLATFGLLNYAFFMMVRTGATDRYRAMVFVPAAFLFSVGFIAHLIEMRGSMSLGASQVIQGETPFCHMVIPMIIIPAAIAKTIIFPGSLYGGFASIGSMLVIWAGASLALGRGWCSWVCFFGGFEDGFSRILKVPVIRKVNPDLRWGAFLVLGVVAIVSALLLAPFFCEWLCPFKVVTEYDKVVDTKTLLQAVAMVLLFGGLVVALPLLTRKRIQCGTFCPFGAFQTLTNAINCFVVRIDAGKCVKCKRCIQVCPVLAIDEASLAKGRTLFNCIKCGKCIDACPKKAIEYRIRGVDQAIDPRRYRWLFLYPAFLFLATFNGGMIYDGLRRILLFVTTGSFLH